MTTCANSSCEKTHLFPGSAYCGKGCMPGGCRNPRLQQPQQQQPWQQQQPYYAAPNGTSVRISHRCPYASEPRCQNNALPDHHYCHQHQYPDAAVAATPQYWSGFIGSPLWLSGKCWCGKPKYVEPKSGLVKDFCGKSHIIR